MQAAILEMVPLLSWCHLFNKYLAAPAERLVLAWVLGIQESDPLLDPEGLMFGWGKQTCECMHGLQQEPDQGAGPEQASQRKESSSGNLRDEKVSARKPWVGASKLVHTDLHVPIQRI